MTFLQLFDNECLATQRYHMQHFKQQRKWQNLKQKKISVGRKRILKNTSSLFFGVNVKVLKRTSLQALWDMLQPLKHWRRVVFSSINIKKWFLKVIREITVILSNNLIQWDNLNVLKMKTSWYLYRKINFRLLINN